MLYQKLHVKINRTEALSMNLVEAEWKNLKNRRKKWKRQFRVKGGDTRKN